MSDAPFTKDHPFKARLTASRLLNAPGSSKETRHFEVDLSGSGLTYAAGWSLGVFPTNNPRSVQALVDALGATGEEMVVPPRDTVAIQLWDALLSRLSISQPTPKFAQLLAERATAPAERERLAALVRPEAKEELAAFLEQREFEDLLEEFPSAKITPAELVGFLRKLAPRLYSIASGPGMHPASIHLTVAVVRYQTNGRAREGVCSTFLADRVPLGEAALPVFLSESHFGLPENPATDVIMVGPGTGVAPFRAFLQEHVSQKRTGRTWLFFGDQHEATDFLYADEFKQAVKDGSLTRLDCAWSRDQAAKVYVQDKMLAHGAELWSWLQNGASFFVCGDAKRMAKDVDAALHQIAREQGGMDEAGAVELVKRLKKEKRYLRDVY